jgi:MFS transporter, DHA2 family, multidrug resistance protein
MTGSRGAVQRWSAFHDQLVRQFPVLDPRSPVYRWLVLACVMIGTFMAVLDATIVNVALPNMMATFGITVDHAEWILTAYLLVFGVMLPSSGWFADRFGYKKAFLAGLLGFTLGSFLSSLAWNINALLAFRLVQGAGAGFLMPVGMAIITREFPPEKRGVALGFWTVSASASVSLGPTIGGYLVDRFTWHTIFDVNVPVGALGILAGLVVLRDYRSPEKEPFDAVGFGSLAIALAALLLALSNGNSAWNTGGWTSRFILACFAIAIVAGTLFLATEFTVRHPLIQMHLFRSRNFAVSNLVLFVFGIGMFGSNFLLPIYLQNSLGYTPLQAGLIFLPVGLLQGLTAPLAGMFADRFDARLPAALGLGLLALTLYQLSSLSLLSQHAQILPPVYLRGIAMGLLFAPMTTIALSEVTGRQMAQASGLINVIRQIGGSFGVALFGTLFTRRTIFHSAIYGQQMDPHSAAYAHLVSQLRYELARALGGGAAQNVARAKALLGELVGQQATVQAVDDVFFLAAITLLLAAVPLVFVHHLRKRAARRAVAVAD